MERYTQLFNENSKKIKSKQILPYSAIYEKSKAITVKRGKKKFVSPEPGNLSPSDAKFLAQIYADYREKGYSKERAAKASWGAIKNRQATKGKENKNKKKTQKEEMTSSNVGPTPEHPVEKKQEKGK
jgi:hypothetical protein